MVTAFVFFPFWRYRVERRYDSQIIAAAHRYGLEPGLVKAAVWRESRFNASARGRVGELGLMQVGDVAAHEWASAEGIHPFSHEQCLDPLTNVLAGAWYLRNALNKYTTVDNPLPYALAEYNAGRGNVLKWKTGAGATNSEIFITQIGFPSTSNYVRDILSRKDYFQKQFAPEISP